MTLAKFGFFDDIAPDHAVRLLTSLRSPTARPNEVHILKYLASGTQVLAVPSVAADLLDSGGRLIGPSHVFTDGVWAWSGDVHYYLRNYHIAAPEALVQRMRSFDWHAPALNNNVPFELEGWGQIA